MNQETTEPLAPESRSRRRRFGWRALLSVLILISVVTYYMLERGQVAGFVLLPDTGPEGPFKLIVRLPGLGTLESFRQNQAPAREICRKLGLPEFHDISGIDPDGQKQFYNMFLMLRAEPKNHDKYGLLGQLYEGQKFPDLATQLYQRAIAMAPDDYEWHYALGLRLMADGQPGPAEVQFKTAADLHPDYAPVWMQMARLAVERDETDAALANLDRYISLRPQDPFGYVERADVHYLREQWDFMQKDLDQARELERQHLGYIGKKGHRLLGALFRHLGQEEDSRVHLLMSAEDQPGGQMDDPIGIMPAKLATLRNPLANKLRNLFESGRYQEALALQNDVLDLHRNQQDSSDYGKICGIISECYRQVGDYSNALAYAGESCRVLPNEPEPHASLALASLSTGKLQAAIEEAEEALQIKADYPVARYVRGQARIQLAIRQMNLPPGLRNNTPESLVALAITDLENAVAQKPVNHAYLLALANACGMLEQYDQARKHLDTALRVKPEDPETLLLKSKAEAGISFWPVLPNR